MSWNDSFNLVLHLVEPDLLRLSKTQEIFENDISRSLDLPRLQIKHCWVLLFVCFVFLQGPSENTLHSWPSITCPCGFWRQGRATTVASQSKWAMLFVYRHYEETNCLFSTWIPVKHVAQTIALLRDRYFPYFCHSFSLYNCTPGTSLLKILHWPFSVNMWNS